MSLTKRRKSDASGKLRYGMRVIETIEYSTVIESDKKLSSDRLRQIAEERRIRGGLSMEGVRDVDIYCDKVSRKGAVREMRSKVRAQV